MRPFQPTVVRGFFKVDPHNDEDVTRDLSSELDEAIRIFQSCLRIVDRAGANNGEDPIVAPGKDVGDSLPRPRDGALCFRGDRNLLHQDGRCNELAGAGDANVVEWN